MKEAPPAEEPAANGEGEAAEKEGEEEATAEVRFLGCLGGVLRLG